MEAIRVFGLIAGRKVKDPQDEAMLNQEIEPPAREPGRELIVWHIRNEILEEPQGSG